MSLYPSLASGDRVAVVAPSSSVQPEALASGISYLETLGFEVVSGDTIGLEDRFLAGPDLIRGSEVSRLFADPSIRGIFAARGGYGSARILSEVDWAMVEQNPKVLVGFSDTTALQLGALARANLVSYSGFLPNVDVAKGGGIDPDLDRSLIEALLHGRFDAIDGIQAVDAGGRTEGRLVGGCLSLVASLVGTPYLPPFDSSVVFLEDVGEAPYRIDRMLTQLIQAGVFEGTSAVLFGQFVRCDGDDEDGTVDEVIEDFAGRVQCPVYVGLPYGHGATRRLLPVGGYATIENDRLSFERGV